MTEEQSTKRQTTQNSEISDIFTFEGVMILSRASHMEAFHKNLDIFLSLCSIQI